jgi:hypothetical protein
MPFIPIAKRPQGASRTVRRAGIQQASHAALPCAMLTSSCRSLAQVFAQPRTSRRSNICDSVGVQLVGADEVLRILAGHTLAVRFRMSAPQRFVYILRSNANPLRYMAAQNGAEQPESSGSW